MQQRFSSRSWFWRLPRGLPRPAAPIISLHAYVSAASRSRIRARHTCSPTSRAHGADPLLEFGQGRTLQAVSARTPRARIGSGHWPLAWSLRSPRISSRWRQMHLAATPNAPRRGRATQLEPLDRRSDLRSTFSMTRGPAHALARVSATRCNGRGGISRTLGRDFFALAIAGPPIHRQNAALKNNPRHPQRFEGSAGSPSWPIKSFTSTTFPASRRSP